MLISHPISNRTPYICAQLSQSFLKGKPLFGGAKSIFGGGGPGGPGGPGARGGRPGGGRPGGGFGGGRRW